MAKKNKKSKSKSCKKPAKKAKAKPVASDQPQRKRGFIYTADGWPINPVKRVRGRERTYRVVWKKFPKDSDALAYTNDPKSKDTKIEMRIPLTNLRSTITTLIDEAIHANIWELDNDAVDRISDSVGDFVFDCVFGNRTWA